MAFLLLATVDSRGERLHEVLTAQGWWVSLVSDRHDAMRAAAAQEPRVVIVDALLPGARELVGTFSSRNGGPGSIVLGAPESQLENLALVEAGADELLSAYPRVEELSRAIERLAESPQRGGATEPILVGKRLSANEIFGDILREVDGEGPLGGRKVPAAGPELAPPSPVGGGQAAAAVEEATGTGVDLEALAPVEEPQAGMTAEEYPTSAAVGEGTGPGVGPFDLEAPVPVEEPQDEMTADGWPVEAPEPDGTDEVFSVDQPGAEAAEVSPDAGLGGEVAESPTSAAVGEGKGTGVDPFDLEALAPVEEPQPGMTAEEYPTSAAVGEGKGTGVDPFDLEAPVPVEEPQDEMTADGWPPEVPEPDGTDEVFSVDQPGAEAAEVPPDAGLGGEVAESPTSAAVGEGIGPGVDPFDLEAPVPVEEAWAEMTADGWPPEVPEPDGTGEMWSIDEPSADGVDAAPLEELEVESVSPLSFDELDQPEIAEAESRIEAVESAEPSVLAMGEDGRHELVERAEAEYGTGTGLSEASDFGPLGGSRDDGGPQEIPEPAEPAAASGIAGDSSGLGQYQLEERIAVGGMAEVWRGSMVGLEGFRKAVAIKKILPHLAENEEFVRMFVDEAKLAAQLSHENLVDIYDLGKMGKDFFIAMELVEGHDLRSILDRLARREERFPIDLALYIGIKLAAALDYAHSHCDEDGQPLNLVHRDVSPRNVLISHGGNIRLCDFGVAKAVSSVPRTEIGALKGKLHYMSPEQAAGASVDSRSDLFSLGSVLYEMITGRRPFLGDSEISLLEAVRRGKVEDPRRLRSDLPQDVAFIVKTALEKSPGKRWGGAGELQLELEEALYRLGAKPSPATLANWLAEIYREDPPPVLSVDAETVEAAPAEAAAVEEATVAATSEEQRAQTVQVIIPGRQVAESQRFWLGVLAGFLLAAVGGLAAALLLGYF